MANISAAKSEGNVSNKSSYDSSDSDICYLPPTKSCNKKGRESRQNEKYERKPDVYLFSTSKDVKRDLLVADASREGRYDKRNDDEKHEMSQCERRGISGKDERYASRQLGSRSRSRRRESWEMHEKHAKGNSRSNSRERNREKRYSEGKEKKFTRSDSSSSRERRRKIRNSYEKDTKYESNKIRNEGNYEEWKHENSKNKPLFNLAGCSIGDARKIQRKGEKKTFYCPLCMIELNSEDTKNSHVNGVKHTKKDLDYKKKMKREAAMGRKIKEINVYQIPNPEAIKKKVPIRLHEKIKESVDPVVGLDHIREFIAVSDPEMEPYYECELCGSQGHANMIFGHIMGSGHRQKFVNLVDKEEIKKGQRKKYRNMTQSELLKFAMNNNENNERISNSILTSRSDEEYPWPPGKAPWSIEKGGTGIAPDNARENRTMERCWRESENKNELVQLEDSLPMSRDVEPQVRLPPPSQLKAPQTFKELGKYLALGSSMVKMAIDYSDDIGEPDNTSLKAALASMVDRMGEEISRNDGESSFNSTRRKMDPRGGFLSPVEERSEMSCSNEGGSDMNYSGKQIKCERE